jgi:hypothetical protein
MIRRIGAIFLGMTLFCVRFPVNVLAQVCAQQTTSQTCPKVQEEMTLLESNFSSDKLLSERAGGCFTDCFLNPFGSEECDSCRISAAKPMPEWTATEKILWSIGGLLLTLGLIWASQRINSGNNCNANNACGYNSYYGGNPYGYYSDPYGYGSGAGSYYGNAFAPASRMSRFPRHLMSIKKR